LELPILKCQLGLFGYAPQNKVVKPAGSRIPDLEKAIQKELLNDCVPCPIAFSLAEKFNVPKMVVSLACEKMGIRINSCQWRAF
jgi:hypothetical protein